MMLQMQRTIRVRSAAADNWIRRLRNLESEKEKALGISPPLAEKIFISPMTKEDRLGFFRPDVLAIVISESLIAGGREEDTENIFLHELAHALDYRENGTTGHGPSFRTCCRRLGLEEGFDKSRVRLNDKKRKSTGERIKKLLALSSSPFENESAAAIRKAQQLMMEYGNHTAGDEKICEVPLLTSSRFSLGTKAVLAFVEKESGVFLLYAPSEDGRRSAMAYGSLDEVEFALYLTDYLLSSAEREIRRLRREGEHISRDSFMDGMIRIISGTASKAGTDTALVSLRNRNEESARRIVYPDTALHKRRIRSSSLFDDSSYGRGSTFARNLDIKASRRTRLIGDE